MKSLIEPIELALLKLFSSPFAEYGIKTYFNYFDDVKKGFIDTKVQDLGNRAFMSESESVVLLYKRTSPLVKSSLYGKTGMPKKLIAINRETGEGFEKDYVICDWSYEFNVLSKYRGNEEFSEFIFNFLIKRMKKLNFSIKVKNIEVPLSYSINISDIETFEKMDESFLDNVYSFSFTLEMTGMVMSPFSRENSVGLFDGKFEIYLFGEKTTFDIENDYNELISVVEDNGEIVTFDDLKRTSSQTNELIEVEKEIDL